MSDAYDVLGIAPGASERDIDRAWKQKLRDVHPDRHPDATPSERALLERRTREVNVAHDELLHGTTRQPSTRQPSTRQHSTPPSPAFGPDECDECGAVPAEDFEFKYEDSEIWRTTTGHLCRDCAQRIGREVQTQQLEVSGVQQRPERKARRISGLHEANHNRAELARAGNLGRPVGRQRAVDPPGPTVTSRWSFITFIVGIIGIFLAVALIALVIVGLTNAVLSDAPPTTFVPNYPLQIGEFRDLTNVGDALAIEDCVTVIGRTATKVDCSDPLSQARVKSITLIVPPTCGEYTAAVIQDKRYVACAEITKRPS